MSARNIVNITGCTIETVNNYFGQSQEKKRKKIWYNIKDSAPSFAGRCKEIEEIKAEFESQQVLVLSGLGGIGKSELARKYIWENKYKNVVWLNAETPNNLKESIHGLAQEMDIAIKKNDKEVSLFQLMETIYSYFDSNCLFIFDNALCYEDIVSYLPKKQFKDVKTLITSQNREWGRLKCMQITTLTEEESVKLIKNNLGNLQEEWLKKLVNALQFLPLALQQAAAYIADMKYQDENYSIENYLEDLENKAMELLNMEDGNNSYLVDANYERTVYLTIHIALDKIKKDKENSELAEDILNICSYLSPDEIPKLIFNSIEQDTIKLNKSLRLIAKYSIVNLYKESISIHRLVQKILRLDTNKTSEDTLQKCLTLVTIEKYKFSAHCASVLSHMKTNTKLIENFYSVSETVDKYNIIEALSNHDCFVLLKHLNECFDLENMITILAVCAGAENDNVDLMKLLISKGGSVNEGLTINGNSSPLNVAACQGSFNVVQYLVDNGADINSINDYVYSPFLGSVESGHLAIVKYLISKGADINIKKEHGYNALHVATIREHINVVRYLINSKNAGDINYSSDEGYTALHIAAEKGNLDIIKLLTKKKASFTRNHNGQTPLHIAIIFGHVEVVKYFIEIGANIFEEILDGIYPIHLAAFHGHPKLVELFANEGNINSKAINGFTPLIMASEMGHKEVVELLLSIDNVDINAKNSSELTALHLAIVGKHVDVVKVLLDHGIEIGKTSAGASVIHIAAQVGSLEIINLFSDLNIDDKTINLETPLILAAYNGQLDVVKYLCSKGSDINSVTDNGLSALYLAAQNGYFDVVKFLIENGADVEAQMKSTGTTPLFIAVGKGHKEIVKYLLDNDANIDVRSDLGTYPVHHAAENGDVEIFELLMDYGADIDGKTTDGSTSLMTASSHGHRELVKYLLSQNCCLHDKTSINGSFPLYFAAKNGHRDIVEILLENKVNINDSNNFGWTALHVAAENGHTDLVQLLINSGINIEAKTNDGYDALELSFLNNQAEALYAIFEYKIKSLLITNSENDLKLFITNFTQFCCENMTENNRDMVIHSIEIAKGILK